MDIISYLMELFNEEKVQGYIPKLRWKDKELQCPHCGKRTGGVRPLWNRK